MLERSVNALIYNQAHFEYILKVISQAYYCLLLFWIMSQNLYIFINLIR